MVPVSDIFNAYRNEYGALPDKVKTVSRTTPDTITEALYQNAILDSLDGAYPQVADQLTYTKKARVPDYGSVIELLGIEDDKGVKEGRAGARTALEKFVEDFPKHMKEYREDVVSNPAWGEKGWETVKRIWRQTVNDKMYADIAKARRDAFHDGSLAGWLARNMAHRSVGAYEQGREPTTGEIIGDVASNLAYMVPAGYVSAPLKMAASRFLPSAIVGAGKLAAGAAGQFAAPTLIYGADKVLGNETSWVDPLAGGLTNMGVNKVLGPQVGKMLGTLSGKISSRLPSGLRQILEGTDTPRESAMQTVQNARNFLSKFDRTPTDELMEEAFKNNRPYQFTPERLMASEVISDIGKLGENKFFIKDIEPTLKRLSKVFPGKSQEEIAAELALYGKSIMEGKAPKNYFVGSGMDKFDPELAKVYTQVFKENPELRTLLTRGNRPGFSDMATAYAINQYGNNTARTGKMAGGYLNIPIDELVAEDRAQRLHDNIALNIGLILNTEKGLTDEDRGFLKDIANDPMIVRYGHNERPEEFKKWMLMKGHELLTGTPAAVPTWEVE